MWFDIKKKIHFDLKNKNKIRNKKYKVHTPPGRAGVFEHPPQVFRQIAGKRLAERRNFWHSCSYIFPSYFVKISDPGHSRSSHQVTPSDLTSEKL